MEDKENNNVVDDDFKDIQDSKKKSYVKIVIILYIIVAILSVLLVLGIKNQKSTVEHSRESSVKVRR